MNAFEERLAGAGVPELCALGVGSLQVNVGLRCNQACAHCHLGASPARAEAMTRDVMARVLVLAGAVRPDVVDVTGGAPEMHPELRWFVRELRGAGHTVQVRTNLTILVEPGYEEFPAFFRDHQVRLVASLPCYLEEDLDRQRGTGAHRRSVAALRRLNELGYGSRPGLELDLVFNPGQPGLPPDQAALERDYRRALSTRHGVSFSRLLTMANFPIGRFGDSLRRDGRDEEYLRLLCAAFNPCTIPGLMCRRQIEVGWDGLLYDCDFNLALGLPAGNGTPLAAGGAEPAALATRRIRTGTHCFVCTAGAGTS